MSDTFGSPFVHVTTFDEALELMRRNEQVANDNVTDDQRKIVGDCFVKRYISDLEGGFWIYGEVWSIETFAKSERDCFGAELTDEDKEELHHSIASQTESYERGYRFGNWYSIVELEGELGSAHIVSLALITKEEFDQARERGWRNV